MRLAQLTYPNEQAEKYHPLWQYRLKFILRASLFHSSLKKLQTGIAPDMLEKLLTLHNRFLEKPMRPYLTVKGSPAQRAEMVVKHYQFVTQSLPSTTAHAIYQAQPGLELAHFSANEDGYRLALMFDARYQKEGEMTLKLLDSEGLPFYALSFSIIEGLKGRELMIGGIQGPASSPENNVKIKALTKTLHGLRPKDLMIKMLTIVANIWQVEHILAVRNRAHIYRARRYEKGKVKADYDAHWRALNATEYNRDFVELNKIDIRKAPEDISRPKRAMYRRRYEWLDSMAEIFEQKLRLRPIV